MISVDISADNDLIQQLLSKLYKIAGSKSGAVLPSASSALMSSAKTIQRDWRSFAMGNSIEGLTNKFPSTKLAQSIKIRQNNLLETEIYSESPQMARIVKGTQAWDMKTKYPYGRRSRVNKQTNVPYLIIPFRWYTPTKTNGDTGINIIPANALKLLRSKKHISYRTGEVHFEKNAAGNPQERSEYQWNGYANSENPNAQGMVRMLDDSGKKIKSTYFTFRVISAASPAGKWWRKAVPPVDIITALKQKHMANVQKTVYEALQEDLNSALGL